MGFFLSRTSIETLEPFFLSFGKPFIRWDFDDGSSISMVAWDNKFDRGVLTNTAAPRTVVPLTASGEIGPEHFGDDLTGMLWNKPESGVPLQIVELGGISLRPGQGAATATADP